MVYILKFVSFNQLLIYMYLCIQFDIVFFFNAVCDDLVYQFVTTPPISRYFSDLAQSIREQYVHLDSIVHAKE